MGMISFHELESVDEDDTSHGHEDPVFDVDEWKEILATCAGAPRQLNDFLVCLLWTAVRDRASNHMSSGKFGGKDGPGNLLKCRGRGDGCFVCFFCVLLFSNGRNDEGKQTEPVLVPTR